MKSILDPSFKYTKSTHTDLRKTFARIRREQAAVQKIRDSAAPMAEVARLPKRNKEAA